MELEMKPREYQKSIFETAREKNTLVVLPTGLGKTLIALLLTIDRMNLYRGSKTVILAPTRPLVEQHMKSFQKNLPELYAQMELFTGSVNADKRKKLFGQADIVFSTPQCVANDLDKNLYNLSEVSLLVIDEAHRCLKNYDYTKVVESYKRQSDKQRILGLTASPGSESDNVREICRHLDVEEIEFRTRDSEDVKGYLQKLDFQKIEVPFPQEMIEIRFLLKRIYDSKVNELREKEYLAGPANKISLLKLQNRLANQVSGGNFKGMYGMSLTAQAIKISHAIELLETQTISGLDTYMRGLIRQSEEKKSKAVQILTKMSEFNAALISIGELIAKGIEHPKIEELAVLVENEFKGNSKSKFIVFTQFRESAVKIKERLNKIANVRASTFFGQAKKTDTGMSQKEQKEIIGKLNEGELNVLVATSIGEEGLDISEVSGVVFYEPIPSAIRKIQRAGRTARLKPGKLFILVTTDTRDEINHYASSAREKKMAKIIEMVRQEIKNKRKDLRLDRF